MNTILITHDVVAEIVRQNEKWGGQRELPSTLWATILMEEVGEVAKAILEKDNTNAREELVQCAALCYQVIEAIDTKKFKRD